MGAIRIAVHGGAGAEKAYEDGCEIACNQGAELLRAGGSSLDAAVAAVVALEDDGRFNAGTGSVLCLDGSTVEMDAAVMDTRGELGAVACIHHVKNPILVAREVAKTPHHLLVGEGADNFARAASFAEHRPQSKRARQRHAELVRHLRDPSKSKGEIFRRYWNYEIDWSEAIERYGCGTVGAVALDIDGHFAVATSTGGSAPSLLGRVGDTPLIGCGFYAGPAGAVAVTGIGEHIMRHLLARTVYDWIEAGTPLEEALKKGVALFPQRIDVGIIALHRASAATCSNRVMPVYVLEK